MSKRKSVKMNLDNWQSAPVDMINEPMITITRREHERLLRTIEVQRQQMDALKATDERNAYYQAGYHAGFSDGVPAGAEGMRETFSTKISPLVRVLDQASAIVASIAAFANALPDRDDRDIETRLQIIEAIGAELARFIGLARQRAAAADDSIEGGVWSVINLSLLLTTVAAIEDFRRTGDITPLRGIQGENPVMLEIIQSKIKRDIIPDTTPETMYLYGQVQKCRAEGVIKFPLMKRVIVSTLDRKARTEGLTLVEEIALGTLKRSAGDYLRKLANRWDGYQEKVNAAYAAVVKGSAIKRLMTD